MSAGVCPVSVRNAWNAAAVLNSWFLAVVNVFSTSAGVTLIFSAAAWPWSQSALIRYSIVCAYCDEQAVLSSETEIVDGAIFFSAAMHFAKVGGSGMITGLPGSDCASPSAATYSQWARVCFVIGLPATTATESPGIELPQADTITPPTKMAPSARITRTIRFTDSVMVAS